MRGARRARVKSRGVCVCVHEKPGCLHWPPWDRTSPGASGAAIPKLRLAREETPTVMARPVLNADSHVSGCIMISTGSVSLASVAHAKRVPPKKVVTAAVGGGWGTRRGGSGDMGARHDMCRFKGVLHRHDACSSLLRRHATRHVMATQTERAAAPCARPEGGDLRAGMPLTH